MISVFQELDESRAFVDLGYTSLFSYSVSALGLSESVTSNLIAVARKAREMPALHEAIQNGELSVSKARKITPVLALENQREWVAKAQTMSSRKLEEEVAKLCPRASVEERVKPVCEDRLELRVGISKSLEAKLKRVQDLESQRISNAANLEHALEAMADVYLERKDPVIKAERILNKSVKHVTGHVTAKAIPATIKHQVQLRDGGQCAHLDSQGVRCGSRRWLDVHHIRHRAYGGDNGLENLVTLCSAHHRMQHSH
ncbi:MAG: HNH endonuclease signature motif containing protein [Oligoflexia bacterium]|nr:HNH endonuclease signature motif containing protein [Oligoflexia bacterium]